MQNYRLLKLLIWKNALCSFRNYKSLINELINITVAVFTILIIRFTMKIEPGEEKHFNLFSTNKDPGNKVCNPQDDLNVVAFSPSNEILSKILQEICPQAKIMPFESSHKLEKEIDSGSNITRFMLFAVTFNDDLKNQDMRNILNYKIILRLPSYNKKDRVKSWFTELLFPAETIPGARLEKEDVDDEPSYQNRGFLYLQETITQKLIENINNSASLNITIRLRKYPYPKWTGDRFYTGLIVATCSQFIAIIFYQKCLEIATALTAEKETQLKESMKQMGLPGWLLWTAWFFHNMFILILHGIIVIVFFFIKIKNAPIFKFTDLFLFFTFWIIASCPTITFGFLLSTWFSKASNATLVGSYILLALLIPFMINASNIMYDKPLSMYPPAESVLFLSGISYALVVMLRMENVEEGIQWNNFMNDNGEINFAVICLVLLMDAVLYMLLAFYIDAVFPGEFGTPQPWNFLFTSSYWKGTQPASSYEDEPDATLSKNSENIEEYSGNLPRAVTIRNLSKAYGPNYVVRNLNLDMYESQITVLLGHNGAGKTTTVSMISGMILPTGGTIEIYGYDLKDNTQKARSLMGVCPQHNVHFEYLTVAEHLYFFSVLKEVPQNECKEQVEKYLKLINLDDKKNNFAHTLSGGMKRKLSVGIAICGNSKLIILDEPTAGLDPEARRTIWNLLQSIKKSRAILLITHYMDEADLLGDRIGIMTAGRLECMGTGFFLKKKYSTGYNLILEVDPACQPSQVTGLIRGHISSAKVHSYTGTELSYELSGREVSRFPNLLKEIESRMNQLGIKGYGISPASLEEIFLKVGADQETKNLKRKITGAQRSPSEKIKDIKLFYGAHLWALQIFATFMKKLIYVYRKWLLYLLTQIILPVLLVVAFLSSKASFEKTSAPALNITIDTYSESIFLLSGDKNDYYNIYKQYLKGRGVEVSNLNQEILKKTAESFLNTRKYIAAASFEKTTAVAWFNSIPLHSPALALSLILNTVFQAHLGSQYSIDFTNYPLPLGLGAESEIVNHKEVAQAFIYVIMPVTIVIILFYIKERSCSAKHLEFTSGLNAIIYWAVSFIFDYTMYFVACLIILATAAILVGEEFTGTERLKIVMLIFACFGAYIIIYSYFLSYATATPQGGMALIVTLFFIAVMAQMILPSVSKDYEETVNTIELVLFFITPYFIFSHAIAKSEEIYLRKRACEKIAPLEVICKLEPACCDTDYYAINRTGIGREIVISLGMSLLLFTLILLNDLNILRMVFQVAKGGGRAKKTVLEEDVEAEKEKIQKTDESTLRKEYILVLKNVTKYYCCFLAVNNISVAVRPFECFGLLGTNGAGKTTTFRMMTGDVSISSGKIWVGGYSVKTRLTKIRELVGYCPQFSAVLEEFTTKEVIKFFALIKGVPLHNLKDIYSYYAEALDFTQHLDKKVSQLSGGNKRKLSVVIALLGNPTILFLDEPTAAMDPATKRSVWNAIAKVREEGKSIILTSHVMEECEALCTRVAIMVKGTFQCLGSTQRLKNKFAQGYTIRVKLKKSSTLNVDADAVIKFVTKKFYAQLLEQFQELLTFQITDTSISCSTMFQIMEEAKGSFNIEDYSVQQCSLEEVFLKFAEEK